VTIGSNYVFTGGSFDPTGLNVVNVIDFGVVSFFFSLVGFFCSSFFPSYLSLSEPSLDSLLP
jgi:hypothetical protein